jgi:SAM-dependent methyltransferase
MKPIKTKELKDIVWEEVSCPFCGGNYSPVLLNKEPLQSGQFDYKVHPVICECGLVYLNPRWSSETYSKFYTEYYDELYRLDDKEDYGVEGIMLHMKEVHSRCCDLCNFYKIKSIIDIGSGSGYGFDFLREKTSADFFAIESSPESQKKLELNSVKVVDSSIEGDWSIKYESFFDLCIMRHVVEHLLNPIELLTKIRNTLSDSGYIYCSA